MPACRADNVAIVAIGRNEGERLKACLRTTVGAARAVVYVDSGSSDGSAAYARQEGCLVVELDPARPFTAARARNEGFAAALAAFPEIPFIQFLDGDCEMAEGWLDASLAAFALHEDIGIVFGRVREIHPEASAYNLLADLEWRGVAGPQKTSGGRFLIRSRAFQDAGGFREDVIAAEDDEFCVRVRAAGWKIELIDAPMGRHDIAMHRFAEWWLRMRRTGHAYAQVYALHGAPPERYFERECRRVWIWGLALPLAAVLLAPFAFGFSIAAALAIYALQYARVLAQGRRRGWAEREARVYAWFTMLGKFPAFLGLLSYGWRRLRGHSMTIIEYRKG